MILTRKERCLVYFKDFIKTYITWYFLPFQDPFEISVAKKQSGRKRWGGGVSDTWDDFEDLDFGIPRKQKAAAHKPIPAIKRNEDKKENIFNDDEDDFLA